MDFLFVILSIITVSFIIITIINKYETVIFNNFQYRQSDIHNIKKYFYVKEYNTKIKESQMTKRTKEKEVKIALIEDKAYWVADNVFYVADLVNDNPDMSTARPIDTSNLSKDDIDKMLFILDNIGRGENNERGSAGNK